MKKSGPILCALIALATLSLPACAQGPETAARLAAETARLRQALEAKPAADPNWKDMKPRLEKALARAEAAFAAGYLYYGLEELGSTRGIFRALEVMIPVKATMAADGLPGFDREWQNVRDELAALDREARGRDWRGKPVALRALSELAQGTTLTLVDSSKAYSRMTQGASGPYNLGEAKAAAELAAFCHALPANRPPAPFPLRSVRPELDGLQARVNASFRPPRSIELHSQFIGINSAIKQAEDLEAMGFHAGALHQYLDGVQQFGLLDAAAPDEAGQARVRQALAGLRAETQRSKRDDSLARLFLERAEAAIAGKGEAAPGPDDWKTAAVIAEQVLPAYHEVIRRAPPRETTKMASAVTVTLVRWPYT